MVCWKEVLDKGQGVRSSCLRRERYREREGGSSEGRKAARGGSERELEGVERERRKDRERAD